MKQKMVIKVSMPCECERSRSRAMALAARADGVVSMEIAGDARDILEVVGDDGIDAVCLFSCLRRKVGHDEILQVEEVKDDKPVDDETTKEPDEPTTAQPEAMEPTTAQPEAMEPTHQCYHGYYYYSTTVTTTTRRLRWLSARSPETAPIM